MTDALDSACLRLHGRQFVIGPREFAAAEDWRSTKLGDTFFVSHCPLLSVATARDAQGQDWMLLGTAVQSDPGRPDPIVEIALTATAAVPDLCESWAGRWVLAGDSVYMDAAGLLGCFYGTDSGGATWVSSSAALLAGILFAGRSPRTDDRTLRYEIGTYWFVPPLSRFAGMHRLLPSQALHLKDGSVRSWSYMSTIDPSRSVEETSELLIESLVTIFRRASFSQPLWLALSAGADSRLILAVAHRAGAAFKPYTRVAQRTKLADRLLPPLLASELGYTHTYFPYRSSSRIAGREQLIADHGAGHVAVEDVQPFLDGSRDSMSGTTVGGNCFGVGKAWGRGSLPADVGDIESALPAIASGLGEPRASSGMDGVRRWLHWCRGNPVPNMDWRDRCYIEVRLAGWLSCKEQIYDMTSLDRFVPINSMRNYSLLLSIPESLRRGAGHQAAMIRSLSPELMRYPFNPRDLDFGLVLALQGKLRHPMQIARVARQKVRRAWNSLLFKVGR